MRAALILLCLAVPVQAALGRDTRLPWRFMDPVAVSAYDGIRRSAHPVAEDLTRNVDADDHQGLEQVDGRSLNFSATDLHYVVHDLNRDGRPEVFLLPLGPGSSGSSQRATGIVMVAQPDGEWRVGCTFVEMLWNANGGGLGIFVPVQAGAAWSPFRTQEGRYGWDRRGRAEPECSPRGPPFAGRTVRPGERLLYWHSIDRTAVAALYGFRNSAHPIANAMAINHEGDRIGVDRTPGRPRNFDASSDLLYAVRRQGRRSLVFLLFDWPTLQPESGLLPGVVMLWDGSDARARIACTIHDRGERGAGGGVTLLDARAAGLPDFRTSAGRYAWRVASGGTGPPECHLVGAR